MTTSVTYSVRNGVLVQDGLDPLHGIRPPGPGTCINCGEYLYDLTKHFSSYVGYMCTWQSLPNGQDPRPFMAPEVEMTAVTTMTIEMDSPPVVWGEVGMSAGADS